jgi:hypothetical protein
MRQATPARFAAIGGDLDCIGAIGTAGADFDVTDANGEYPADWEARAGHCDVLDLLMAQGRLTARPALGFATNQLGSPMLPEQGVKRARPELVRWCLTNGFVPNLKLPGLRLRKNCLIVASARSDNLEIV